MLLAPGVRSGRSHRCYFHWCVRSSHPCAPNIPNYQSVHVAPKSPNNSNWCLLRLKPCGPHSSMGLLEILNQIWGWLSDYGANPQIPWYKQSNNQTPLEYLEYMWPNGPIDIHINNWCNCTWTGNLQFTIHKFTNHKSNTCLDSGISCLTGQWFFVLVLHIHRHSNPTQWITSDQKKNHRFYRQKHSESCHGSWDWHKTFSFERSFSPLPSQRIFNWWSSSSSLRLATRPMRFLPSLQKEL